MGKIVQFAIPKETQPQQQQPLPAVETEEETEEERIYNEKFKIYEEIKKDLVALDVRGFCMTHEGFIPEEDEAGEIADIFMMVEESELNYWDNIKKALKMYHAKREWKIKK